MVQTTRTLNPLPFKDLEPHRFEDLVRALLYDFRPWLKLEGTGRSGGDSGFDVRGWEPGRDTSEAPVDNETSAEDNTDFLSTSRLWLIQCKRERTIGPAKLKAYLESISTEQRAELDGIIFAAACDFSKQTRDEFRSWCVDAGIGEYHLWGNTELEDELYRPKNDGLLFAFFGISLVVRQRSLRTELRARLATKRKILKLVGQFADHVETYCVFRDPTDDRYPDPPLGIDLITSDQKFGYNWFARPIVSARHNGIIVLLRKRMAYIGDDGVHWDRIDEINQSLPPPFDAPWEHNSDWEDERRRKVAAEVFWRNIPESNRARGDAWAFIPYESILAIDEDGDDVTRLPVVFVKFDPIKGPFEWGTTNITNGEKTAQVDPKFRIKFFPTTFPEPKPQSVD